MNSDSEEEELEEVSEEEAESNFEVWQVGECHYRCEYCQHRQFSNSVVFQNHVSNDHKVPLKIYRQAYGNGLVKSVKMTCAICNEEVLYDFGKMKLHFLNKHRMELREYFDEFVRRDSPTAMRFVTKPQEENLVPIASEIAPEPKNVNTQPPTSASSPYLWANKCSFKCYCGFTSHVARSFRNHTRKKHALSTTQYKEVHGDFSTFDHHECRQCGKMVVHDYDSLRSHFATHNLKLHEYHANFIAVGGATEQEANVSDEKAKTSEQQRAPSELECKPKKCVEEKRGSGLVYYWLNKCVYTCKICDSTHSGITVFNIHILKFHGMGMQKYRSLHGECRTETEFLECRVCGANKINDAKNVGSHIINVHKMTLLEYHNKYYAGKLQLELAAALKPSEASNGKTLVGENGASAAKSASFSKVRNACLMKCPACPRRFCKSGSLLLHLREKHEDLKATGKTIEKSMVKKVFYTCLECQKSDIFCDVRIITKHLKANHHVSLGAYNKKHQRIELGDSTPQDPVQSDAKEKDEGRVSRAEVSSTYKTYKNIREEAKQLNKQLTDMERSLSSGNSTDSDEEAILEKELPLCSDEAVVRFFSDLQKCRQLKRYLSQNASDHARKDGLLKFIFSTCFKDDYVRSVVWPSKLKHQRNESGFKPEMPPAFVSFFTKLLASFREKGKDSEWKLHLCDDKHIRRYRRNAVRRRNMALKRGSNGARRSPSEDIATNEDFNAGPSLVNGEDDLFEEKFFYGFDDDDVQEDLPALSLSSSGSSLSLDQTEVASAAQIAERLQTTNNKEFLQIGNTIVFVDERTEMTKQ